VSAIIAPQDPAMAAAELKHLIGSDPPFVAVTLQPPVHNVADILEVVPSIIQTVGEKTPLSHNMTNLVVQNFAANIALAVGASPIMTNCGEEAEDLCKLGGALVINMGSVTVGDTENYLQSLRAYNLVGGPVVFDPVGAGATALRRSTIRALMAGGYFDVIKGNEAEISAVFGKV
jgi:thiamine-phosphate diphosphorylase / hydroxyethylthiazole kinase